MISQGRFPKPGNDSEEFAEESGRDSFESEGSAAGYCNPQNVASGFTNSNPASQASWLRHTTSASFLQAGAAPSKRKPLGLQARQAAEAAVALAKGQPAKTNASISNGARSVPAIFVNPVAVTKANVKQTVIKDGFQNLETIQKSLPKEKWPQ